MQVISSSAASVAIMSTLAILALMMLPPEPSSAAPSPSTNSHPLCVSQYALVSQSCAQYFLRRDNEEDGQKHMDDHDHEEDQDEEHEEEREHDGHATQEPDSGSEERHEHRAESGGSHEEQRRQRSQREHRGRTRSAHARREGDPDERDCCRWLEEMDDECVCDLLIRLPPFLTKARHNYSIAIAEACQVTYQCGDVDE